MAQVKLIIMYAAIGTTDVGVPTGILWGQFYHMMCASTVIEH